MKKFVIFLLVLSWIFQADAQQLVRENLYKIGNSARGIGSSTLTRQGSVIVTGSYQVNPGYQSVFTLVNQNGDTIWMRNGPLISIGGIGIKESPKKGYYFYTTKHYTSPVASGPILQNYSANGLLKWTMAYPNNMYDIGYKLLTAQDSGYYLGGQTTLNGKIRSFTIGRTDSLGNLKWRKGYDWSTNDFFSDMQHTRKGNIIMYGKTGAPQRLKLLVVNPQGDSVLGRSLTIIGGNRQERLRAAFCSITPLSDGGYLMAAEIDTFVANAPPNLGMVVKVDSSLNPVWHYINHSVPNNITFTSSRELTDGTMVVLAYERKGASNNAGDKFFLYRFSAAGTLLNVYTFTSNIATQVQTNTMEALSDSSFIVGGGGVITPFPNYSAGFYVAKVKIAGLAPALPLPGAAVVTGLKPEVAISKASLGQSYPNPTAGEAIIPYTLPQNAKVAVITINEIVTGRQVKRYDLKQGESSLNVNLRSLNTGIYTYTLYIGDKPVATKKLSVVK